MHQVTIFYALYSNPKAREELVLYADLIQCDGVSRVGE